MTTIVEVTVVRDGKPAIRRVQLLGATDEHRDDGGNLWAQPTWIFRGKGGESGAAVVRQFTRPGTYDVTVTPDDGKHLSTSRGPTSELLRVDRPPVAVCRTRAPRLPGRRGLLRRVRARRPGRCDPRR
jgi:hypothetical protein